MKKIFFLILFSSIISGSLSFAQWSTNPQQNNQISTAGSGAAVPYVVTHPCGTSYISWFTPDGTGNYMPWMQRLDVEGNLKWAGAGIQISSHPSMTWITDYSLAISPDTAALIAFEDMRATANDIFIYKIGSSGAFLWGNDGVQLSNNPDFEADPVMAVHPDGSVVVAWPRSPNTGDYTVILQRLNKNGQKQWNPDIVAGESGFDYNWPRLLPFENDRTLLICYKEWGPYWAPNRNILALKYDSLGNQLFFPKPVLFTGAMPLYVHPLVTPDGLGGAYVCWFYERITNHLSTFVAHVDSSGIVTTPANGVEVSTNGSMIHIEPGIACDSSSHDLYVFWREQNSNQTVCGVYGQRVGLDGTLKWDASGKMFVPVSSNNAILINVTPLSGGAVVGYLYADFGNNTDYKVRAIRVDSSGNAVWSNSYRDVSTYQSAKGYLASGPDLNGQIVYAWNDGRLGNGEQIFAQNLSESGILGPLAYDFFVNPDTLYFLTPDDFVTGKSFYIHNPHNYNLDMQYIQNWGIPSPPGYYISWYTQPSFTQFPVTIPANDSLKVTVRWIVTDQNLTATLVFDTLMVNSITQSTGVIIVADSIYITAGMNEKSDFQVRVFPNPFSDQIRIETSVPAQSLFPARVYNTLMEEIRTLSPRPISPGQSEFIWDGKDDSGQKFATGLYFVRIQNNAGSKIMRVLKR